MYVWGKKMLCGIFVFESVIDEEESFKCSFLLSALFCFLLLSLLQMDAPEADVQTHAHTHTHTHKLIHEYNLIRLLLEPFYHT